MHFEQLLFLCTLLLMVFVWVGYPFLLLVLGWLKSEPRRQHGATIPSVSIIIAAYNEEQRIEAKLSNCQGLLYPSDRIEILVASDFSTDQTESIVEEFARRDARIRLVRSPARAGKSGVQNLAVQHSRGDILFFTDADTRVRPEVLQLLVENLADPRAGLISAEVHFGSPEDAVACAQSFYWRFELFLRRLESDLGILATASGSAFAMRRELFRPLPTCYGDDCIAPLDVRLQGYRVLHEPRAVVFDRLPHSIQGELRARIRMTARNWSGTLARGSILNPFRFPLTSLGLLFHKLLRWLTPFLLAITFAANTGLALRGRAILPWMLQLGFYFAALVGWMRTRSARPAGIFGYPFSFCLANVGFFLGMVKVLQSQRIVAYQSAE